MAGRSARSSFDSITSRCGSSSPGGLGSEAAVVEAQLNTTQTSESGESLPPSTERPLLSFEQHRHLQDERVLHLVSRALLFGGVPLQLFVVLERSFSTRSLLLPWLQLACGLLLVFCINTALLTHRQRRYLVASLASVLAVCSIFEFGPLMGTGLLCATVTLLSAMLLGPIGALMSFLSVFAALGTCLLQVFQVIPVFYLPDVQLNPEVWARTSFATAIFLLAITYFFSFMTQELWKSLGQEVSSRLKERSVEEQRQKLLSSAAANQRLEALGRLAGGVAHDFNNALVVIQCGVSELREHATTDKAIEIVEDLDRGVERAAGTARQLLSFARRNAEEVGSSNPRIVVEDLLRSTGRMLPAHISLSADLADTCDVPLSESSLEQVLLNLIINSRDALPRGGHIRVRVAYEEPGPGVVITVEDDGEGMSDEVRGRAFDPFFTTKGERGTGLGLAMVWGAVRRVGGQIKIRSAQGEGTSISLHLPESSEPSSVAIPVAPLLRPGARPDAPHRILLLEDELPVQRAMRRILSSGGYEVTSVARSQEARDAMEKSEFSLLVTDGVVPDGGVGELILEFRKRSGGRPVVVCSGYLEEDLAIDGIARGRYAFLPKPFQPEALLSLVKEVLASPQRKISLRSNVRDSSRPQP